MSIFGNSQAAQPSTSSPFGATMNKPSLFGSSTTNTSQPLQTSSLFGGLNQNQNQSQNQSQSQQQGGSSLFGGNTQQQQQPQTSSLFGQPQNQNQQNSQQQQPQQQQQQSNGGGLFGASQAQNANQNTSSNSLLQSTSQPFNSLAQSRMQMSINEVQKREESLRPSPVTMLTINR